MLVSLFLVWGLNYINPEKKNLFDKQDSMESKIFSSWPKWIFQEPFGGRTFCVKKNPKAMSFRVFC